MFGLDTPLKILHDLFPTWSLFQNKDLLTAIVEKRKDHFYLLIDDKYNILGVETKYKINDCETKILKLQPPKDLCLKLTNFIQKELKKKQKFDDIRIHHLLIGRDIDWYSNLYGTERIWRLRYDLDRKEYVIWYKRHSRSSDKTLIYIVIPEKYEEETYQEIKHGDPIGRKILSEIFEPPWTFVERIKQKQEM